MGVRELGRELGPHPDEVVVEEPHLGVVHCAKGGEGVPNWST